MAAFRLFLCTIVVTLCFCSLINAAVVPVPNSVFADKLASVIENYDRDESGIAVPTTTAASSYQKEEINLENNETNHSQINNLENVKRNKRETCKEKVEHDALQGSVYTAALLGSEGAIGGGSIGAAIGTGFLPGVGTVIGAIIGGIVGTVTAGTVGAGVGAGAGAAVGGIRCI